MRGVVLRGVTGWIAAGVLALAQTPEYRTERPRPLTRFNADQIALLEKLNRADRRHLGRLPAIIVPSRWDLPELAYSPMPQFSSWAAGHAKALIVDLPSQVFGAYEYGHLVRWGPVSSGRARSATPAGLFHLNWSSRSRRSSIDESWLMEWYFNFDSRRGIAFHKYSLPGRPASHACVRMLERDARWLYGWGEGWITEDGRIVRRGTPVLILGRYDFSAPRPWLAPDWWARGVTLPEAPARISRR